MICPDCDDDGVSFWRVWLLNFRQRVICTSCSEVVLIKTPGRIALGTFAMLLASTAAFIVPGGSGLGLALLLLTLVTNFLLTHAYAELEAEGPEDAID